MTKVIGRISIKVSKLGGSGLAVTVRQVAPFAEQLKNPGYIPWTILSPLNYALPPLP
jgi:hypothetical protein